MSFQGLERHLLGTHGLVTASMQDMANKGQDSGRCPVCGKMFHWKLLNHVANDHKKTLKPAHLSYKCTVCTQTFGQYKLFENHVYSAHSGGRKIGQNQPKNAVKPPQQQQPKPSPTIAGRALKVSDEITIIPQGKNPPANRTPPLPDAISIAAIPKGQSRPQIPVKKPITPKSNVIEIEEEEQEIDDVEEEVRNVNENYNDTLSSHFIFSKKYLCPFRVLSEYYIKGRSPE